MSRVRDKVDYWAESFPRVSGDEPCLPERRERMRRFSPRERG